MMFSVRNILPGGRRAMDSKLQQVFDVIRRLRGASVCCPEAAITAFAELGPDIELVPYFATSKPTPRPADIVVIHKGQLGRIDRRYLANVLARHTPVAGNEVYVAFAHPALAQAAQADASRILPHLGPIENFCRNLDSVTFSTARGTAVIVSAQGVGNIGDDAVTIAAGAIARRAGFRDIVFTGPSAQQTVLERADLVIVGGGGLFYDRNYLGKLEAENVANYTAPLRYAREAGKAAAILGIGTQGIHLDLGKQAFARAIRDAHVVTARDPRDVEVLQALAPERPVELTADLAFALSALDPAGEPLPLPPLGDRCLALVSLAATMGHFRDPARPIERFVADVVLHLARDHEVVLAQHSSDDAKLYDMVARVTGARVQRLTALGVRGTLALYGAARTVVASRFHGMVFAALAGARIASFSTREGKIGRVLRHSFPSLLPGESDIPKLSAMPVEEALDRAVVPDPAEVRQAELAALRNIELLNAALEARNQV
jgi:hypothetical protein